MQSMSVFSPWFRLSSQFKTFYSQIHLLKTFVASYQSTLFFLGQTCPYKENSIHNKASIYINNYTVNKGLTHRYSPSSDSERRYHSSGCLLSTTLFHLFLNSALWEFLTSFGPGTHCFKLSLNCLQLCSSCHWTMHLVTKFDIFTLNVRLMRPEREWMFCEKCIPIYVCASVLL